MEDSGSILIPFYLGERANRHGDMIDDVLAWDNNHLENVHNYIQWLFPLSERSLFNGWAPILKDDQIKEFRNDPRLQAKLRKSFLTLLSFYGFSVEEKSGQLNIFCSDLFQKRIENWLTFGNHNFLRITRILKCLMLLGLKNEARAFEKALEEVYSENQTVVGAETLRYWQEAVK